MNAKTPAEQQLEFLKKLKEQQQHAKPPARRSSLAEPENKKAAYGELGPSKKKKPRKGAALPLSREAWARLRDEGVKTGILKLNQDLGDWAVELLLSLPLELRTLSPDARQALFSKLRSDLLPPNSK